MPGRILKIVIVEDDASMRKAIVRILHTAGHNTKWYESAEAVVDMEAAMTADCLILDIELPGMSGLELYRTLKHSGLTTPAIIVTARDEHNMRDEAERLGAANYLTKPFSGRALLTAVAEATGSIDSH
jgi:FixJ family two-component response regulator